VQGAPVPYRDYEQGGPVFRRLPRRAEAGHGVKKERRKQAFFDVVKAALDFGVGGERLRHKVGQMYEFCGKVEEAAFARPRPLPPVPSGRMWVKSNAVRSTSIGLAVFELGDRHHGCVSPHSEALVDTAACGFDHSWSTRDTALTRTRVRVLAVEAFGRENSAKISCEVRSMI